MSSLPPYPQPYLPTQPTYAAHPDRAVPQTYSQRPNPQPYWTGQPKLPWNHQSWTHPAVPQRLYQVRLTKHTGLIMAFFNQKYTVTGTLEQCQAAIREAQLHNLVIGWWSFSSVLVMNWIALLENLGARKTLRHQATQQ